MRTTALAVLLAALCLSVSAQDISQPDKSLETSLSSFLRAFENLEWDAFRNSFADDATVFYPRGFPERASGRPEFEANFRQVFKEIRGSQTHPPYMHIDPRALQIQRFGDIAIVTFHLDDRPGMVNRRTLVLEKRGSVWKIVHLHASEVSRPAE